MIVGTLLACLGCAKGGSAPETSASEATLAHRSSADTHQEIILTAGTSVESTADERALPKTFEPEKGSPEWLVREIARIRSAPVDVIRQPAPGNTGAFEEVRLTPEQVAREKHRRNEVTVQLAMQAIAKTHQDSSREQLFNSAVHYLADARMELALSGDERQFQLMIENADALFSRDATSFAAVESAARVLQFTQAQAQQYGAEDARWGQAFARQARLFADRFPQETSRAAVNLIAAGRICERFRLAQDAQTCYETVEQKFSDTPFSEQVAGPLRRLRLPGNALTEFGGSTHDGGFLSLSQLRGKPLLIVFWASNSAQFQADLPVIQATLAKHPGHLTAVGVNFDRDETAVDKFLEQTGIEWKNVFYSDPEKRGAHNPVAQYYGVINVPQYWLVDAGGVVRSVDLQLSELEQTLTVSAD